ncbi:MAG: LPS export ABC transporter ATP-binding protein [Thermoguttaceae bacterium]|nr:LPS export ABC transporter ATP-binding protein [Thermoguttaceae bacterium]
MMMSERTQVESNVVLQTEGLVKKYGKKTVVNGVSFKVRKSEVVGLLGANGAGKTTSFRMTCGLIPPDAGTVWLNGIDVTDWPMYRRAKEGRMGYLPQERSTFNNLTVEQNLYMITQLIGLSRAVQRDRVDNALQRFNLTQKAKQIVGDGSTSGLSGGERRRLEVARAMLTDPAIIMLDEPFANVDPKTVYEFQEVIMGLVREGIAILITDHQINETLTITNRSYVIDAGQVLCAGTPLEVLSNPEARKRYFGNSPVPPEQLMETLEAKRRQLNDASLEEGGPASSRETVMPASSTAQKVSVSTTATKAKKSDRGFVVKSSVADALDSDDEEFVAGKHATAPPDQPKRTLRRDRRNSSTLDDFVDDCEDLPTKNRRSLGLKRDEDTK